jgi:small neutral amino acid transporter SnatA (MarC family)
VLARAPDATFHRVVALLLLVLGVSMIVHG